MEMLVKEIHNRFEKSGETEGVSTKKSIVIGGG
jgi:hypothetical protein